MALILEIDGQEYEASEQVVNKLLNLFLDLGVKEYEKQNFATQVLVDGAARKKLMDLQKKVYAATKNKEEAKKVLARENQPHSHRLAEIVLGGVKTIVDNSEVRASLFTDGYGRITDFSYQFQDQSEGRRQLASSRQEGIRQDNLWEAPEQFTTEALPTT